MASDLEIIKELEKEIGKKLKKVEFNEIRDDTPLRCYAIDENGNVIGLCLDKSGLNEIPELIFELEHLLRVDLYNNKLTKISGEIKKLSNLQKLNFSDNKINTLPSEIGDLGNLLELYLYSNQLKTFPVVIAELKNLQVLSLVLNQLTALPREIGELKNLQTLYLSSNRLTSLPKEICELGLEIRWEFDTAGGVILEGNPLESPPIEIVKKGRDAVIEYFRSLEKGEKLPLNEVKVLLVGDGAVGKTSLMKRLLGEEFDKDEPQTYGINIRDWKIEDEGKDINVHFWDFGGQVIMHATHQFFLSKRSLYVLVLDGRKEEDAEYWLKLIESFGGDSPIIVVLNKIDQNVGFDLNRKFLQEKYEGIKGFCRVSCSKDAGITAFSQSLSKVLEDVEIIATTWPKTWFSIKTQLENMKKSLISYDEYKSICSKQDITEKASQDILVDFLNDLGVILHFKDFKLLDTHVLEPRWVTQAVYRIINSQELADCKGVLKLSLLDKILQKKKKEDYYYPPDKYRYIIDLMMKFELCYELDDDTVLIPDLLEVQEPEIDFDYDNSLKFLIDYDFFPKSLMPRFIVRMHKDIKADLHWRTGVVLEDKAFNSSAVIKADERDKKIYIYVNGEQKRDYFSAIRKTFGDINGSFEKLEVKEWVPLPDNEKFALEYAELVGYELEGKEDYFVGKLRKSYSVLQLLNGIEKPEERMKKYESDRSMKIEFSPHIEVSPEMSQKTDVRTDVHVETKIETYLNVYLPTLKSQFDEFKDEVADADPKIEKELEKIEDSLDEVSSKSKKESLIKPMNKLGRFLQKLGDENSNLHKIVAGTKKGIQIAQKVAKTYNKFAQWLALPQMPDLFLKDI